MKKNIGVTTVLVLFSFVICSCSSNEVKPINNNISNETSVEEKSSSDTINQETTAPEQTAYHEWMDALSSENKGTKYENITLKLSGVEELYSKGLIGTDDFKKALSFMTGKDTENMSSEEMISLYEEAMPKMKRYFTTGYEGSFRFLEDIEAIGNGWASMDKDTAAWTFDFETEDVANHMNLGEEVVECILGRLCDYGFNISED